MIAERDEIKDLIRGDTDCVRTWQPPPDTGRVVPLQPGVGKRAKCRARVLDSWDHAEGGWVVRLEPVPDPHVPRLLPRAAGGYVSAPGFAMTDYDGSDEARRPEPEPEAVDEASQAVITERAHMHGHQENARRRLEFERRTLLERLEDAIIEQERLGIDSGREMARLEAGIAKLERRNAIERQQRRSAA